MTLVQIARALSVSPGTLSNWQKRYDDFPAPAGFDGNRRFFRISDVQNFMKRHDLKAGSFNGAVENKNSRETKLISLTVAVLRDHVHAGNEIILAISAIAASTISKVQSQEDRLMGDGRHTDAKNLQVDITSGLEIFNRLNSFERESLFKEWSTIASELDQQKLAAGIRRLLKDLSGRKVGGEFTTSQSVASLMSKIANALDVLDLCSGYGTLLREYRRGSRRRVGVEINASVASISRLLAFIEGYEVEIYTEDSLSTCHQEWLTDGFFGVVVDPPLVLRLRDHQINQNDLRWTFMAQSRRHQAEDFWIQSTLSYLKPSIEGVPHRGVLLLRGRWFFENAETAMRDALLKFGLVEAVVALGAGSSSSAGVPMNLLVLRKGIVGTTTVRMIDAQKSGRSVRGVREFSRQEIDTIVGALNGNLEGDPDGMIKVLDVPIVEILENGSVLEVRRYINETAEQVTVETGLNKANLAVHEFQNRLEQLQNAIEMFKPTETITKLTQKGIVFQSVPIAGQQGNKALLSSLFKNRPSDRVWTKDDIVDSDIVVCLVGFQAGRVLLGSEFHAEDTKWSKVWILRSASSEIDQRYLATWARYGGLDLQIRSLVSGTTLPTLTKRDAERVLVPVPSMEVQEIIAQWGDLVQVLSLAMSSITESQSDLLESIHALTTAIFVEAGTIENRGAK